MDRWTVHKDGGMDWIYTFGLVDGGGWKDG